MSRPNSQIIALVGFGAALVLLGGIATMSYFSLQGLVERMLWVTHTQEVLRETEAVVSYLKDVESGDRGYLISGRAEFLATYHNALVNIPVHLDRLQDLTADEPGQQERVRALHQLSHKRMEQAALFLKNASRAHINVSETAQQHIMAGKITMDEIRGIAVEMRANGQNLLAERAEESKLGFQKSATIIMFGTVASFTILIGALILLRREIGQRTRAERAARQHATEVESLYNQAPCGYHSVDNDGIFVRINNTELSWLGYAREEVIGKLKFIDIVAPECVQIVRDNFPTLIEGGITVNLEYTLVRKDGTTFPVSVNAVPLLDASGKFVMSRTTMFDITAMKEVENRLRMANAFLDAVVENIPSMIFVKNAQSLRYLRINRAEEELLGIPRDKLINSTDHDFFSPEQAQFFNAKDREALQNKAAVSVFEEQVTSAGVTRSLRTRKIALRDTQGEAQYLLGIADDITEQKRTEEAIRTLNASLMERANQLEAANKELESFSYSVSHDLRAPLRAIDGFSKIVEEEYGKQLDEEGLRLLRVVRENSQRMGILIDDLLAFSRLGRQPLSREWMDMKLLATSALAEVQAAGFGGNARAVIHDLPRAHADPVLLKQVWINLLSNAVKYSSTKSEPHIEVGFIAPKNADDQATYFVKDNGVGFDMRYYDRLFGVFQRLHRVDEFSGTGVGLAIVHRLIARHGGRVWAEAELDQGATFYFTLPEGGNDDGL
ncbi:MAG: PAS domain-containing protein [Betaproteobacteria bacterium]|jgi:PAS domain S-box-containing protein